MVTWSLRFDSVYNVTSICHYKTQFVSNECVIRLLLGLNISQEETNQYEGLGARETTPYAKLELYENYKN